MSDRNVYFIGICTHLWWTETEPHYTKRVILLNGRGENMVLDHKIGPHIPTLRIAAADVLGVSMGGLVENVINDPPGLAMPGAETPILEWILSGTHVEIENATGEATTDDSYATCIPHLQTLTSDIGPPSWEVVNGSDPDSVSCHFHITGGRLFGRTNSGGASLGLLEVPTGGNSPRIRITSFAGGEPRVIDLKQGSDITLSNTGAGHDAGVDFFLHYKTAQSIPEDAVVPVHAAECKFRADPSHTWPLNGDAVGPGCSNSGYP